MKTLKNDRSLLILGILFLAWTFGSFNKIAINVAAIAISKEFGLNSSQIGLIMSSFFISYAFMSLMGGYLADKFGSKKVVTATILLWSIFTCFTGAVWSFTSLIAIRFICGASEGGFPSASSVTIAELFKKEKRARAKSFLVSSSAIGVAFGTIIVSKFTVNIGWRSAFCFFGTCGLIIAAVFFKIFKSTGHEEDKDKNKTLNKVSLKEVLKISIIWKLTIMEFSIGVFMWGMNSWMPSYWVKVRNLDMVTMGKLSSIPWIITFVCMNFSGWILDKLMAGREKVFLSITFAITGIFTYLMYNADTISLALFYLTVTTIAIGVSSTAIFVIPLKYMKRESIGTVTGILNFGQQLAGILAPSIMGYMITIFNGSYIAVFLFVIFTVAISFVISLTIDTNKNEKNSADIKLSYSNNRR
ncbi:MAG: MFS transporter [Clostridium sp.]|uniref:MFS transporter n=1 Tax=Clostridium sp. TaxID=1506 RepID=UPI0025B808D1|nr:MFS transporter [Clostridium sp.]MCE5219817.1 MFS transporter [Clostridium sp.]